MKRFAFFQNCPCWVYHLIKAKTLALFKIDYLDDICIIPKHNGAETRLGAVIQASSLKITSPTYNQSLKIQKKKKLCNNILKYQVLHSIDY